MKLPDSLNTVTSLSKCLAMFLFVLFPLVGFWAGLKYQSLITPNCSTYSNVYYQNNIPTPKTPTQNAPTVNQLTNWKVYDNLGVSFRYPIDLEVLREDENAIKIGNPINNTVVISILFAGIQPYSNPNESNLFTLSKVRAIRYNIPQDKRIYIAAVQTTSTPVIEIRYAMDTIVPKSENTFDLFLSSFKFTGKNTGATNPLASINIKPNSVISSPLTIVGEIDSNYIFEGTFPIILKDDTGQTLNIVSGNQTPPSDWTKDTSVKFSAVLTFSTTAKSGSVVFCNDNPSGLPENHKEYAIPVKF